MLAHMVTPGFSFSSIFTAGGMAKLGQIIVGDLTMAGDNVVIMGSLASGLPERDRRRVLMLGVGMALAFLITFAVLATQLLKITGLVFAGGLLLLWVAYNMWKELHPSQPVVCDDPDTDGGRRSAADQDLPAGGGADRHRRPQHEPRQRPARRFDRAGKSGPAGHRADASPCCSWALQPITSRD